MLRSLLRPLGVWGGLLLFIFQPNAAGAGQPAGRFPDSTRLAASPPLPDTARLHLLMALSRAYGPSNSGLCIRFAQQGMPLAVRLHDGQAELGFLDNIAVSYARLGDLATATRYSLRELQLARRLGNHRYEVNILSHIANAQDEEGNHTDAENTFRQALQLAETLQDPLPMAWVQNQLASHYLERRLYAEATRYDRAALATFQRLGRLYEAGACHSELAEAEIAQGHWDEALHHGRQAVALMQQKGDVFGLAQTYAVLSRAARESGDLPMARRYGQAALESAEQNESPATEADALLNLIAATEQMGNCTEALTLQKRLQVLRDTLYNQTRAEEMARLQTQYDTETKRQEIRALRQKNLIQSLEQERARSRMRWLGGVVLLLLIGLISFAVLYRRLQQSRASLHASNRTKDQLLSIVGHDLRGPVSAFQQLSTILRHYARRPDTPALLALADDVEQGSTQLAGLLDNMLHWARAQMSQVVNQPTALPPAYAIQTVANLYRHAAAQKHLHLTTQLAPDPCPATWADAALLDAVLRNLVSNAVKFTPEGGQITVAANLTAAGVEFSVRDTGVGLPPHVAILTDPVLTPTRGTAGEAGTGLGISVCRQFIALLGGQLQVESQPDQGTRFWFTLPLAPVAATVAPVLPAS